MVRKVSIAVGAVLLVVGIFADLVFGWQVSQGSSGHSSHLQQVISRFDWHQRGATLGREIVLIGVVTLCAGLLVRSRRSRS